MQDERQTPRHVASRPRRPHELTPPCGFGGREVALILDHQASALAMSNRTVVLEASSSLRPPTVAAPPVEVEMILTPGSAEV